MSAKDGGVNSISYYRRWRKVVVDDEVDSFEVDAASHELGADEHPDAAGPKGQHRVLSLLLRPGKEKLEKCFSVFFT